MSGSAISVGPPHDGFLYNPTTPGIKYLRLGPKDDIRLAITRMDSGVQGTSVIELAPGTYRTFGNRTIIPTNDLVIRGVGVVNIQSQILFTGATNVILENVTVTSPHTSQQTILFQSGINSCTLRNVTAVGAGPMHVGIPIIHHADGQLTLTFEGTCAVRGLTTANTGLVHLSSATAGVGSYFQSGSLTVGSAGVNEDLNAIRITRPAAVDFSGTLVLYGQLVTGGTRTAVLPVNFHEIISQQGAAAATTAPVALVDTESVDTPGYNIRFGSISAYRNTAGAATIGVITAYTDDPPTALDDNLVDTNEFGYLTVGSAFTPPVYTGGDPGDADGVTIPYPQGTSNVVTSVYLDEANLQENQIIIRALGDTPGVDPALMLETVGGNGQEQIILRSRNATGVDTQAAIWLDAPGAANAGGVRIDGASDNVNSVRINATRNPAGGINMDAGTSGLDVDSTGQIHLQSSKNSADSIVLNSTAGGIDITAEAGTGGVEGTGEDIDIRASASVNVRSTEADANAITLNATAGGVKIDAALAAADAIDLNAAGGGIRLHTTGAAAGNVGDITLRSNAASVDIRADEAIAGAVTLNAAGGGILLYANGAAGGAGDITLLSDRASVGITADEAVADAITLNATAGGVKIDAARAAADAIDLNAAGGGIRLYTSGAANGGVGDIFLHSDSASVSIRADEAAAGAISLDATIGGIAITSRGAANGGVGDIFLHSDNASVSIRADEAVADAITLNATAGGIQINSAIANTDAIDLNAASGGIRLYTSGAANGGVGDITLHSDAASVLIRADEAATDAIVLNAIAGGVDIIAGTTIDIDAGTTVDIDGTGISIDGTAASNFTVDGADLTLSTVNSGDVNITSAGTDPTAMVLTSAGGIDITSNGASDDIDITATGGSMHLQATEAAATAITIDATAGGVDIDSQNFAIDITATAGNLNMITATSGDVNITSAGTGSEALKIQSTGNNAAAKMRIYNQFGTGNSTTSTAVNEAAVEVKADAGGILLRSDSAHARSMVLSANGGITMDASSMTTSVAGGDLEFATSAGGDIILDSDRAVRIETQNVASSWIHATNGAGQDLLLSLTGATNSSIELSSTGTAADAIKLNTTVGGVDIDAEGGFTVDSGDAFGIGLTTGNSATDNSGGVVITTGTANTATKTSGAITMTTGGSTGGNSGGFALTTGAANTAGKTSGSIVLTTGTSTAGTPGQIALNSSGVVSINAVGTSNFSVTGNVEMASNDHLTANTGTVSLITGNATGNNSGAISLTTGSANTAGKTTGGVTITTGSSTNGSSGNISFTTGIANAAGNASGGITFTTGASTNGTAGNIDLQSKAAGSESIVLNAAGTDAHVMMLSSTPVPGAGTSAAESRIWAPSPYTGRVVTALFKETRLFIDLTGLRGSANAGGTICNNNATVATHLGQITLALLGATAIVGGNIQCLEVPAGGNADIDVQDSSNADATHGAAPGGDTSTLYEAGGNWTVGSPQPFTTLPTAGRYLYLVQGAAGTDTTYTAGRFLITIFGISRT